MNRLTALCIVLAGALIASAILVAPQFSPEADRIRRARAACEAAMPPGSPPIGVESCVGRVLNPVPVRP